MSTTTTPRTLEREAIRLVGWLMALRPDLADRVPPDEMRRMAAETILHVDWSKRPEEER